MTTETLATLTGSEKQIKWAEDIRREALDAIETALTYWRNHDEEANIAQLEMARDAISRITAAQWFIEEARHVSDQAFSVAEKLERIIGKRFTQPLNRAQCAAWHDLHTNTVTVKGVSHDLTMYPEDIRAKLVTEAQ